jgi:anti-sigma regulatory factor (Ser/Thr protein kinase)
VAPLIEPSHRRLDVRVEEDVGALRRAISALASGLPGTLRDKAALVATELGTNLLYHTTGRGFVLYRSMESGVELIAVDDGPGFPDARRAVGFSDTHRVSDSGSLPAPSSRRPRGLGVGLEMIRHFATDFDLYSTWPGGSVLLVRLFTAERSDSWFRSGAVNVAFDGGAASGDGWAVDDTSVLRVLLVDGLGHGEEAKRASLAAISAFVTDSPGDLQGFLANANEAMRSTRGGVIGVCEIDQTRDELRFAGLGNITARLTQSGRTTNLPSRDGSLGTALRAPVVRVERRNWERGSVIIMASDGLRARWDPADYPGLLDHDPTVVAATLFRDFCRGTDDTAVIVVQDLRKPGV